jgi:hypothetical protein
MGMTQEDLVTRPMQGMLLDPNDETIKATTIKALFEAIEQLADIRDAIDQLALTLPDAIDGNEALKQISATLGDLVYWAVDDSLEAVRAVLLRHLGK